MEEIITLQEVKAFPAFYGIQSLINASCLCSEPEQSTQSPWPSNFLQIHFSIILPSMPRHNSCCFRRSKESVRVRSCVLNLLSLYVLRWDVVSPWPKYQAGEPPTEGSTPLCIEMFTNNFLICWPSPPCATQLRAKPWWQGLSYHERGVLISDNAN